MPLQFNETPASPEEIKQLHQRVKALEAAEMKQRALAERYRWLSEKGSDGYAFFESKNSTGEPPYFICVETKWPAEVNNGHGLVSGEGSAGNIIDYPSLDDRVKQAFNRVITTRDPEQVSPASLNVPGEYTCTLYCPQDGLIALLFEGRYLANAAESNYTLNKDRVELIAQFSSDMICLHNLQGTYAWVSPSSRDMLGYSPEELYGISIKNLIHPDDMKQIVSPVVQQAITHGDRSTTEYRLRRKEGSYVWVETITRPIKDPGGKVFNILTSTRDISERKSIESLLLLQRDLALSLADETDLDEVFKIILFAALMIESIDCGGIYTVDPVTGNLDLSAHIGLNPSFIEKASHYKPETPNAKAVMAGKPVYAFVPDFKTTEDTSMQDEGLRAFASIPIHHEGRVIAALNLASHVGSEIPSHARSTIESIAGQVGSIIARVQAETALRESEEKNRIVFENEIFSVYIFDVVTLQIIDINNKFIQQYGYTPEDIRNGLSVLDLSDEREATSKTLTWRKKNLSSIFIPLRIHRDKYGRAFPVELANGRFIWKNRPVVYTIAHDISERREAEEKQARLADDLLKSQVHARMGSWKYVVSEKRLEISSSGYTLLGLKDEGGQLDLEEIATRVFHPEDRELVLKNLKVNIDTGSASTNEYRVVLPGGETRVFLFVTSEFKRGLDGKIEVVAGIVQDITDRKRVEWELAESEKRYREMVEKQGEGIYTIDLKGFFIYANLAAEALMGVPPGGLLNRNITDFLTPVQAEVTAKQFEERYAARVATTFEEVIMRPDGETRHVLITATPRFDEHNEFYGSLGVIRDISKQKQNEEILRYTSTHDALTGLYNRSYYEDVLRQLDLRNQFPVSTIMVDVDNLKLVNDTFGHHTGDLLIQTVSSILASSTRNSDTVARIGGDEFMILLPKTDHTQLPRVLKRIDRNLNRETTGGNHPFFISISVGFSTATEKGGLEQAVKEADRMMYAEKATKKTAR